MSINKYISHLSYGVWQIGGLLIEGTTAMSACLVFHVVFRALLRRSPRETRFESTNIMES